VVALEGNLFGDRLARTVARARIVLSLQTWADIACDPSATDLPSFENRSSGAIPRLVYEGKATRVLPLLAGGHFVLSELPSLEAAADQRLGADVTGRLMHTGDASQVRKGLTFPSASSIIDPQDSQLIELDCNLGDRDMGNAKLRMQVRRNGRVYPMDAKNGLP